MAEGDDRVLEESVIPAKAGISRRSANGPRPEIPAFAGMTAALRLLPCSKCAPTANAAVREAIAGAEAELDGRGRLLIRPSGTEPVIRVMAEGDDRGQVEAVVDRVCEAVRPAAAA